MLGWIVVPIYFVAHTTTSGTATRRMTTTTTTTTTTSATATTPCAQASTILSLLILHLPFSQPRPVSRSSSSLRPFSLKRPSRAIARSPAFSRFFSPPSRSIRSLCTICLPFSVSNTTHGPPGGLVRGSILTAGVARTPILSVPANRRVSSKVSLHPLLRRLSSSGHPRVTLHNHLHRHPLWPPYSTTLCLTPSMSSVTRPWRLPPHRSRPLVHLLSLEHQHLPHSGASSTSIQPIEVLRKPASSSPFPREPSGNQVQNYRRQYREIGEGGRRVSYDVEPGCDVGHRNRCLRAPRELRDAPDTREQGTREREREREGKRDG